MIREENSSYERALFLPLARKPGDLAVCLYYIILLLLERRIDLYEISIRLDPRVSKLGGENVIFFKNAKISKKKLGLQHQVFPGGHPSKY